MPSTTSLPSRHPPRIALAPEGAPEWLETAIIAGGGHVVPPEKAEALVWASPRDPAGLADVLDRAPDLVWIQLPFAGIENYAHLMDDERLWTCGKGVYAEPVAELALGLAVGGLRGLGTYARAERWEPPVGRNLLGARVTILGGGGITESLLRLLRPFDCHVTVVRNRVQPMDGADDVLEADRYSDALPGADAVFLALALTPETEGIISAGELSLMERHAWLINVARGAHVVTDDLVVALRVAPDRRCRARRDGPRTPAQGTRPVGAAQLPHHAPRRQHAGDGRAAPRRAHHDERPPLRRGRGAARAGGRRAGLLSPPEAADR